MKRALRIAGFGLAIVVTAFFLWSAAHSIDEKTVSRLAEPEILAATVFAALLTSLVIPLSAWCWGRLLAAQGEHWPVRTLARIMGLTQLAKYVPGNLAQHAGRATLSLRAGMNARAMITSSVQEMLLALGASLIVGIVMLAVCAPGTTQLSERFRLPLAAIGAVLTAAILVLASLRLSPARLAAHSSRWMRILGRLGGLPGPAATLPSLAAYALNYLMIGIGLWLLARAVGLPASVGYPLVTAAFALSWALGFVAPGMPAGLGVREGIMLLLMQDAAPWNMLLLFVGLARVVTLLGDAICFAVASLIREPERPSAGISS